jgi:lanthanide-dependent methanol dehydrogenase
VQVQRTRRQREQGAEQGHVDGGDDGQARWAHQIVPHDMWDYDEIMENVLVEMEWQGRMRKLLLHPGRTGFMFVYDRETGEVLSAEPFQPINWASAYDIKSGVPLVNRDTMTRQGSVIRHVCPSSTGAKEWVPSAFSPRTALLYIPAHNTCMDYEATEANYIAGTPYLGASVRMYQGEGHHGELVAWDPVAARAVWSIKDMKFPLYSGVLATGGDVVFFGTMDGWFKAVDARSGRQLWQFKTGSGIVGNPMTYVGPDGRQYVAIYSGIGGWMGAVAFPAISADDPYAALGVVGAMKDIKKYSAPGNMLYVFGLVVMARWRLQLARSPGAAAQRRLTPRHCCRRPRSQSGRPCGSAPIPTIFRSRAIGWMDSRTSSPPW